MFLLATAAVAGTVNLGWPCSRMNWAWRNVWSSCSINSYVPANAITNDNAPSHYRSAPLSLSGSDGMTLAPTTFLDAAGILVPEAGGAIPAGVPQFFCDQLGKTSQSPSQDIAAYPLLRNRCRRAIDAYGGIVKACGLSPLLAGARGPVNAEFPDYMPAAAHAPHVTNVAKLTLHAAHCYQKDAKIQPQSPYNTCPGLMGWFTVVWHACGFHKFITGWTTGKATTAANIPEAYVSLPIVAPLGGVLTPRIYSKVTGTALSATAPVDAEGPSFFFCGPLTGTNAGTAAWGGGVPESWNARGPNFRSSRCRKAMDQFGRTAARCGGSTIPGQGPALGSADRLRSLFIGTTTTDAPSSLYNLVPYCN